MKVAFYPGSFNPWHDGHDDVLDKARKLFDKVVVLQMSNADKQPVKSDIDLNTYFKGVRNVEYIHRMDMSIIKAIGNYILGEDINSNQQYAIIRGLRNEKDFCEEQILTYWYEDLGLKMPVFHIIADRKLVHISSSAIKAANKYVEKL